MKKSYCYDLAIALLALLAGCSTPESRIKANPALFASFPPEVQQNVRQGKIGLGYTPEMVQMALGEPDRKELEVAVGKTNEIWAYTDTTSSTEYQQVTPNQMVKDKDGDYVYQYQPPVTVSSQKTQEYDKIRVEFEQGLVKDIKTTVR